MVLRNLSRRPVRTLIAVGGIAAGCSLVIMGRSIGDAVQVLMDEQFTVIERQDATVTFTEHQAQDTRVKGQTPGPPAPPMVLVPKRAITEQNSQHFVWVVAGGTASRRPVTRGADRLDQVEVRNGVSAGDAVILNPPAGLKDSTLVRIKGS